MSGRTGSISAPSSAAASACRAGRAGGDRPGTRSTAPPALLANLLRRRLDSFGIAFSLVYPKLGLQIIREEDDEMRRATCRALNVMLADLLRKRAERMTPAATVPMYLPRRKETTRSPNSASKPSRSRAMRAARCRSSPAMRPISRLYTFLLDDIALDSEHDDDSLWAKCLELRGGVDGALRRHGLGQPGIAQELCLIGMFAAAHESFAKALVMGGVTCRFPTLKSRLPRRRRRRGLGG
jgi:hypothetical protein